MKKIQISQLFKTKHCLFPKSVGFCFFFTISIDLSHHIMIVKRRIIWFCQCLEHLPTLKRKSVGLPYNISQGFTGEDWNLYIDTVKDFSRKSNIEFLVFVPSFIAK